MALYEEPDKPSDALAFVRNNFAATELHTLKAQMENLTQDNEQLKAKVATLEKEKAELLGKVQNLENLQKQNDAAAVESSKPEDVENKEVPEPMEEPKDELKTSEVPAEAATEAQTDVQVIFLKGSFLDNLVKTKDPIVYLHDGKFLPRNFAISRRRNWEEF